MGRRGHRRRHGARHPPLPAPGHPERLERDASRRARPAPAGRDARAAGLRRGRRCGEVSRAAGRRPAPVAGAQALRPARLRGRSRGGDLAAADRDPGPGARPLVLRDRDGGAQPAQVAGDGRHRGPRRQDVEPAADREPDASRGRVLDPRDRRGQRVRRDRHVPGRPGGAGRPAAGRARNRAGGDGRGGCRGAGQRRHRAGAGHVGARAGARSGRCAGGPDRRRRPVGNGRRQGGGRFPAHPQGGRVRGRAGTGVRDRRGCPR